MYTVNKQVKVFNVHFAYYNDPSLGTPAPSMAYFNREGKLIKIQSVTVRKTSLFVILNKFSVKVKQDCDMETVK